MSLYSIYKTIWVIICLLQVLNTHTYMIYIVFIVHGTSKRSLCFNSTLYKYLSVLVCACLQCSVSCGKGKRARYVSCRDAQGGVADESNCAHLPRPPESSACFSPCGQWRAGEWSAVSKLCNTVSNQCRCVPLQRLSLITPTMFKSR